MDARSGGECAAKHRMRVQVYEYASQWVFIIKIQQSQNLMFYSSLNLAPVSFYRADIIRYLQLRIKKDLKYDDWQLVIENSAHSYNWCVYECSLQLIFNISIFEKYILG